MGGLVVCVVGSVLACVIINPLLNAILKRNEYEAAERVGQGVGNDNEAIKKLLETTQAYAQLYNRSV